MEWFSFILGIIPGVVTTILLVIKLIQYVQKAVKEKNWTALVGLVMSLMAEAESKFQDGATRKEWVMAVAQTSAEYINYQMDIQQLSKLIDDLCSLTKVMNVTPDEAAEAIQEPAVEAAAVTA